MKTIIAVLLLCAGISCPTKRVLDKNQEVKIANAYYKKWSSGVRGGGSGVIIFIEVKKEYNLDKEKIKLLHVYFNGGDSTLKKQSERLYQGYIAATKSTIDKGLGVPSKKVEKESFNLAKDEGVLCFIKNGKKQYQKINLEEQQLKNIPM